MMTLNTVEQATKLSCWNPCVHQGRNAWKTECSALAVSPVHYAVRRFVP